MSKQQEIEQLRAFAKNCEIDMHRAISNMNQSDKLASDIRRLIDGEVYVVEVGAALQPQADTSVLQAAPWPPSGDTQTEPEAMRYDFDGYGWKYIDNGSGSDWMTRHPEGEFLFTKPQAAAEPVEPDGVVMGFTEDGCALVEFACEGPHQTPQEGMCVYLSPQVLPEAKTYATEAEGDAYTHGFFDGLREPLPTTPPATQAEPVIPAGFALVPIRATAAMVEAFSEEGWEWANVLAAAEAVTEGEYEAALEGTPPATQAALTAASDCRTCQHLSEAWGVCEARPKCVGGEQYVYFPEKQLWDKTPRNDGQAAHQEMREALYAEFNSAVGRQHD